MADPPSFVKVYTIPTDARRPYLELFRTVNTPIMGPAYPYDLPRSSRPRLDFIGTKAAENYLIYDLPEGVQSGPHNGVYKGRFQPDIHLLPNTVHPWSTKDWKGWGKRAAIDLKGYHLFYLRDKDAWLPLNEHADYQVPGNMFLLKVSDTRDRTGRRFYVDIDCGAEELNNLIKSLGDQEYFGPQKWEKDIQAAKMSLDGSVSLLEYIPTVTKDFQLSHFPSEEEFHIDVYFLKDEDAEPALELDYLLSRLERVALPDTQPYYNEQLSAQELSRTRAVVGNSKFHAFIERAEGEEVEENGNLVSKRRFTLLKVSGDLDRNGRWLYEDFNSNPGELLMELGSNMKQLISHFQTISLSGFGEPG